MAIDRVERGRAAYAYDSVSSWMEGKSKENKKEYSSWIKKIPSMIQVNGLGQTLAFLVSKGGMYKDIHDQIRGWISQIYPEYAGGPGQEFVRAVINLGSEPYRLITSEVLALLNWMRRFADGLKD